MSVHDVDRYSDDESEVLTRTIVANNVTNSSEPPSRILHVKPDIEGYNHYPQDNIDIETTPDSILHRSNIPYGSIGVDSNSVSNNSQKSNEATIESYLDDFHINQVNTPKIDNALVDCTSVTNSFDDADANCPNTNFVPIASGRNSEKDLHNSMDLEDSLAVKPVADFGNLENTDSRSHERLNTPKIRIDKHEVPLNKPNRSDVESPHIPSLTSIEKESDSLAYIKPLSFDSSGFDPTLNVEMGSSIVAPPSAEKDPAAGSNESSSYFTPFTSIVQTTDINEQKE